MEKERFAGRTVRASAKCQELCLLGCCNVEDVRRSFSGEKLGDSEAVEPTIDPETGEQCLGVVKEVRVYPEPPKKDNRPVWFGSLWKQDEVLQKIMGEMYKAAASGSYILASIGLRTSLDRAMQVLGVHPNETLGRKVEALADLGFVGSAEKEILDVIVNAGNAAAHRGWSPDEQEFEHLLTSLEGFVHRTIVLGETALAVRDSIPPRENRQKRRRKK